MAEKLVRVVYQNPQKMADRLCPLGWCNTCIANAKVAENSADPAPPVIHAAVAMIPQVVPVTVPGQGTQHTAATLGACWEHIGFTKTSGIQAAAAGSVPV
jgi:hypothetical protein